MRISDWSSDVCSSDLPCRLRYRLTGTAVVASHGRELTGLWFDVAHSDMPHGYHVRYEAVAEGHIPSWRRGEPFLGQRSRDIATLENLILPLATDGRVADILLCLTTVYTVSGDRKRPRLNSSD